MITTIKTRKRAIRLFVRTNNTECVFFIPTIAISLDKGEAEIGVVAFNKSIILTINY